ncbi:E3 ubiquitin-protein ligase RNF13 isoform X8 [Ixodes scapularis]
MFPHRRMPCHITILYVHSIVSLAALFHATLVAAEIVVIPLHTNSTPELKHIFDQELSFSAMIPDEGVPGRLEIASPLTACSAIRPPPFPSNDSFAWFVLIARFECGLAEKARFAQDAGYDVAVIYDRKAHNNGPFETHITPEPKYYPAKGRDENDLNIYAVIVSEESGIRLKRYTYKDEAREIEIDPRRVSPRTHTQGAPASVSGVAANPEPYSSDERLDRAPQESPAGGKWTGQPAQHSNTALHLCWHRNTSIGRQQHQQAFLHYLSGYLLRKFKNSSGWQKLWVVFTNFCLFFYKSFQESAPLASLPLLGYTVTVPGPDDNMSKEFVFKLQYRNHVYFFRAESEYAFDRWMEVISSAAVKKLN